MERLTNDEFLGSQDSSKLPSYVGVYEKLREYEQLEITPKQVLEMSRLYQQKCEEVAKLEKENVWIPCSERLPDRDTRVLVTFSMKGNFGIEDCWYSGFDNYFKLYNTFERIPNEIEIIAWKPMPEPYKDD